MKLNLKANMGNTSKLSNMGITSDYLNIKYPSHKY